MCDERTFEENQRWLAERTAANDEMSRRDVARGAGAVLAATVLPGSLAACASDPAETNEEAEGIVSSTVSISIEDVEADAFFAHPEEGKHPAVLVWPDAFGLRPALREIGLRLARAGYAALVVNPYYRMAKGAIIPDDAPRGMASFEIIKPYYEGITPENTMTDAHGFIEWLDKQAAVDTSSQMGTIGFCMGGPMVLRTAAAMPARIGAVAAFHPAALVGEGLQSPHQLIPQMDASFLIALGQNDAESRPQEADTLRDDFAKASLDAEIEVYDAQHGWMPTDTEVHDAAQAERGWARMLALFERALG